MFVFPVFISLFVNNFLLAQGNGISCEKGYIPNEGNKTCIKIVYTLATWDEAMKNCQADKGNLLIIDNEKENTLVTNKLTHALYVWVGVRNKKCGGFEFMNADDTKTTYTKWNHRQPDNWRGQEMCVMIFGKKAAGKFQGRWNDYGCQNKLPYVCERAVSAVKEKRALCGKGWKHNRIVKSCIRVFRDSVSWEEARAKCKLEKGDLIIIHSEQENKYITRKMRKTFFAWVGSVNKNKTGRIDLFNVDGTKLNYANWGKGQPDNYEGKQLCINVSGRWTGQYQGQWKDDDCKKKLHFVCEREHYYE